MLNLNLVTKKCSPQKEMCPSKIPVVKKHEGACLLESQTIAYARDK